MPFGRIDEDCNAKQYYRRVCDSLRKSQGEDIKYFTREQLYDQLYAISENDQREIDLIVKAYRKVLREKTQCIEDGCGNPRGSNGHGDSKYVVLHTIRNIMLRRQDSQMYRSGTISGTRIRNIARTTARMLMVA